jgi:predicted metal-dependent peptidase
MTTTAETRTAADLHAVAMRRIAGCQIRLADRHPFFGALLLMCPVRVTTEVPTAATNGAELLFNPSFLKDLGSSALDGLVVHELLHCVLLHVPRRGHRDAELWNIAADIHVNGIIRAVRELDLPSGGAEDARLAPLSVEEIYDALLTRATRGPKPAGGRTNPSAGSSGGAVPPLAMPDLLAASPAADPAGSSPTGTSADLASHWAGLCSRAAAAADAHVHGSVPLALQRALRLVHEPQIDWRAALWRAVVRTPDDFVGFDRRHAWQGLYLEVLEGESVEVDVCIDTSGSIRGPQLDEFLSELRGILGSYPAVRCNLYYADAACHGPFEVDRTAEIPRPKGGGGTDFRPFFAAVSAASARRSEPRLAIYLTDGIGTFPPAPPPVEVLWVVTPGGLPSERFPFGQAVRMPPAA